MRFIPRRLITAGAALCLSARLFAGSATDDVQVQGAYARAVPPGQSTGVAFMSLTNKGKADHALVAAESSASQVTELHRHTLEDGMMKMRRVESIDLPAGETVELQPGGLHLMLIDLTRHVSPGEDVAMTLIFEDGSRMVVATPVKSVQQTMDSHRPVSPPTPHPGRAGAGAP